MGGVQILHGLSLIHIYVYKRQAPLMGSLDDCARRASDLGYDALSLTVKDPNERDWVQVLRKLQNCGLEASGLATGRVYTVDGLGLGMACLLYTSRCV